MCLCVEGTAASQQRSDKSTAIVREVSDGQKSYGRAGRKKALLSACGRKNALNQRSACELLCRRAVLWSCRQAGLECVVFSKPGVEPEVGSSVLRWDDPAPLLARVQRST